MNHRLLTAAQKVANRKLRNWKKTLKKKARRLASFGGIDPLEINAGCIAMLDPERGYSLQYGTLRERRQAVEHLEIMSALSYGFPADAWSFAMNAPLPPDEPAEVTHEFVKRGSNWRRRTLSAFELW